MSPLAASKTNFMEHVDSLIKAFIEFARSIWQTFYWTLFKPVKMLRVIQQKEGRQPFVSVYTYLYISTYLSFLVFYASGFGSFSFGDPESYQRAFETLNGSSLLFLILIIIPYTLLICLLLLILIRILRFGKSWFNLVYAYAIYYFSSVLLTVVASVLFLLVLALAWPKDDTNISEWVYRMMEFFVNYVLFNLHYILAAVPFVMLVRYYYKVHRKRMLQFAFLVAGCLLLASNNNRFFGRLNNAFKDQTNYFKEPDSVLISNNDGGPSILVKAIPAQHGLDLTADIFISNHTQRNYIFPSDSIYVFKGNTEFADSLELFALGIRKWGDETLKSAYLLRSGDIKLLQLKGHIDQASTLLTDTSYPVCNFRLSSFRFSHSKESEFIGHRWEGQLVIVREPDSLLTPRPPLY